MSDTQPQKPDDKPDGKSEGKVDTVMLRIGVTPESLKETIRLVTKHKEALAEAANNRIMTALLTNVHAILKDHADQLYLMGNEADDITRLDPTVFRLFRGLDNGFDYAQLREFTNWFAGGIANRRVSGVPGTEES